jgi:LysM repeat protein
MKQIPKTLIASLLLTSNIQFIQAESIDPYIDALSVEAEQTSMKANKAIILTDEGPEPAVVPDASDNIDMLSREVSDRLEIILTDSLTEEVKQRKLAEMISTAVKKGYEIGAIQNAVSDAMAELNRQENLNIKPEALEFAEKTVNEIVGASKNIAQGDPNDPYIKSLNAEINEVSIEDNNGGLEKTAVTSTGIKALIESNNQNVKISKADVSSNSTQSAIQTIVVLKGESLSKIAGKVYGSVNKYLFLYEANKDQLDSPDLIITGQILKIPPLPIE